MSDYKPTGTFTITVVSFLSRPLSPSLPPSLPHTPFPLCEISPHKQTTNSFSLTENNGLRKDGQPDGRVGTGEFAHGKVDPHEAGKQGGQTGGTSTGGSSDNPQGASGVGGDGLRKDGQPDQRLKQNQE